MYQSADAVMGWTGLTKGMLYLIIRVDLLLLEEFPPPYTSKVRDEVLLRCRRSQKRKPDALDVILLLAFGGANIEPREAQFFQDISFFAKIEPY